MNTFTGISLPVWIFSKNAALAFLWVLVSFAVLYPCRGLGAAPALLPSSAPVKHQTIATLRAKSQTVAPAEVKAKFAAEPTSFSYNPQGKPDPFRPFLEHDELLRKKLEEQRRSQATNPLLQYPIDQYQLVGIGYSDNRKVALVKDVTGKFFELHIGSKIGKHNGRVKDITDNRVTVEETAGSQRGKMAKKTIKKILMLRSEIKEGKI